MNINNKGFSIVYVFIVIMFTISIWFIVVNKQLFFSKSLENNYIQTTWNDNLLQKSSLFFDFHKQKNLTNWTYKDILKCPTSVNYYFSWSFLWSWSTNKYLSWSEIYCSGVILSKSLKIYYDSNFSNFSSWTLGSSWFTLSWTNLSMTWTFWSWAVNFSYLTWVYYDDSIARRQISGYVWKSESKSIFYINDDIRKIIDDNLNNSSSYNKKVWLISSWAINFDITSSWGILKIVEFDKNYYNTTKQLRVLTWANSVTNLSFTWSFSWYLQNDNNFKTILSNAKYFDFATKDYWFFITYPSSYSWSFIKYKINITDKYWSWSFIVPVDDSLTWGLIRYLWTDIYQNWINYVLMNREFLQQK